MWQGTSEGGEGHISMHVILEWIKWYSECFNLQAATEMTTTAASMWQAASEGGVALPPLQKGHNVSMCVILEWIKWYSEGFNLQAAIDGMATGVACAGKTTGWRGGSTTTTESSQPMTQVSPIWMNIQWPWTITVAVSCSVCVRKIGLAVQKSKKCLKCPKLMQLE